MKITRTKKTASLKTKQFSSFFLSFLLPSFLLILLLFLFFINQTLRFHATEYKNTLEVLSSHLMSTVNSDLEMSLSYIFDDDIAYFYYFLYRTDMESDLVAYNQYLRPYTKAVNSYMTLLNRNIRGVGFLPLGQNEGRYFYVPKYHEMVVADAFSWKNADWYEQLKQKTTRVVYTTDTHIGAEVYPQGIYDGISFSIIRAAKNPDTQKVLGYIVVDVSMDFLYSLLDGLTISKNSGIMLRAPSGDFLFSTNPALPALDPSGDVEVLSSGGDTYDVHTFTDAAGGFTFYYLASRKDLYSGYAGAFLLVLAFYSGMALLAFVTYLSHARAVGRSVSPILETMEKYQGGDSAIRCAADRCSITEFKTISDNLNDMIRKINLHIDREYKLELAQKAAEYQALQAEVDPHFLYNILNLFITLNRIGARDELEKAVVSLSHLFRYTCEHTSVSTVEKEFSFVADYLFLQQIRFDDRLTFQIYIEPGLEDFRLPKLIVQPLVENAIVHGLEPSDLTVSIQVTAMCVNNKNGYRFTVISVVNTGLPFQTNKAGRKRVGLKNIEDRLTIFCPSSFFVIGGGEGKPTKCYMIIPVDGDGKPDDGAHSPLT